MRCEKWTCDVRCEKWSCEELGYDKLWRELWEVRCEKWNYDELGVISCDELWKEVGLSEVEFWWVVMSSGAVMSEVWEVELLWVVMSCDELWWVVISCDEKLWCDKWSCDESGDDKSTAAAHDTCSTRALFQERPRKFKRHHSVKCRVPGTGDEVK